MCDWYMTSSTDSNSSNRLGDDAVTALPLLYSEAVYITAEVITSGIRCVYM